MFDVCEGREGAADCLPRTAGSSPHRHGAMTVQSLGRAINFYELALGFEVANRIRDARAGYAVLRDGDGNRIQLREREAAAPFGVAACLMLQVSDFDERRAMLWDVGVSVSRAGGRAARVSDCAEQRAICFCDPDGNELRLVESQTAGGPSRRLTRR